MYCILYSIFYSLYTNLKNIFFSCTHQLEKTILSRWQRSKRSSHLSIQIKKSKGIYTYIFWTSRIKRKWPHPDTRKVSLYIYICVHRIMVQIQFNNNDDDDVCLFYFIFIYTNYAGRVFIHIQPIGFFYINNDHT